MLLIERLAAREAKDSDAVRPGGDGEPEPDRE
jgi:hypothetical protein